MSSAERLARFAVQNLENSSLQERPDLLEAAARFLPPDEAQLCSVTAAFFREADAHQMRLFEKMEGNA